MKNLDDLNKRLDALTEDVSDLQPQEAPSVPNAMDGCSDCLKKVSGHVKDAGDGMEELIRDPATPERVKAVLRAYDKKLHSFHMKLLGLIGKVKDAAYSEASPK